MDGPSESVALVGRRRPSPSVPSIRFWQTCSATSIVAAGMPPLPPLEALPDRVRQRRVRVLVLALARTYSAAPQSAPPRLRPGLAQIEWGVDRAARRIVLPLLRVRIRFHRSSRISWRPAASSDWSSLLPAPIPIPPSFPLPSLPSSVPPSFPRSSLDRSILSSFSLYLRHLCSPGSSRLRRLNHLIRPGDAALLDRGAE